MKKEQVAVVEAVKEAVAEVKAVSPMKAPKAVKTVKAPKAKAPKEKLTVYPFKGLIERSLDKTIELSQVIVAEAEAHKEEVKASHIKNILWINKQAKALKSIAIEELGDISHLQPKEQSKAIKDKVAEIKTSYLANMYQGSCIYLRSYLAETYKQKLVDYSLFNEYYKQSPTVLVAEVTKAFNLSDTQKGHVEALAYQFTGNSTKKILSSGTMLNNNQGKETTDQKAIYNVVCYIVDNFYKDRLEKHQVLKATYKVAKEDLKK